MHHVKALICHRSGWFSLANWLCISARTPLVSTTSRAAVRPARVSSLSAGGVLFTFGSSPDTVDSDNVIDLTHLS